MSPGILGLGKRPSTRELNKNYSVQKSSQRVMKEPEMLEEGEKAIQKGEQTRVL